MRREGLANLAAKCVAFIVYAHMRTCVLDAIALFTVSKDASTRDPFDFLKHGLKVFGYQDAKPVQLEAVLAIFQGEDVFFSAPQIQRNLVRAKA